MTAARIFRPLVSAIVFSSLVLTSAAGAKELEAQGTTSNAVPLASQKYEVDGIMVDLLSVKRSNGFITVKWQYRNTTTKALPIGEHAGGMSGAWSGPYSLSWDFRVIANGQELKVPGQTMAQKHGPDKVVMVKAKKVYTTWAKVPDPGSDVTSVSISIQGTDPFDDVTVT